MQPPPPPRPAPRAVIGFGAKFLLLAGGIASAVGIPLALVFLLVGEPFWADWILNARGVTTEGEVVSLEAPPNQSTEVGTQTTWDIRVRFQDRKGHEYFVEEYAPGGPLVQKAQTKRIDIEYDPKNPELNRLKGGSASFFGYHAVTPMAFALVGIVKVLIGLGLVW